MLIIEALFGIGGIIIGLVIGYFVRKNIGEGKIGVAEDLSKRMLEDAKKDGETHKKELVLEAKDEIHRLRTESERETRERRNEIQKLEKRVLNKEENLDKKSENIERKEEQINKRSKLLDGKEASISELYDKQVLELERISCLSTDEAKEILFDDVKKEISHESAIMIKEIENEAKQEAENRSKEIISRAIQRYAADHVAETTVTVVSLPNDEMKGRIDRKSVVRERCRSRWSP